MNYFWATIGGWVVGLFMGIFLGLVLSFCAYIYFTENRKNEK